MSSNEISTKRTDGRPDADEVRIRLQRAYMVMIRSYLRRHQQAFSPLASTSSKGASDV